MNWRLDRRSSDLGLASQAALAWLVALGLLSYAAAINPPVDHAAAISAWTHDLQHCVIFAASIVVGASLRDLARARPSSLPARLGLAALGLLGIVSLVPPLHGVLVTTPLLHDTQDVILVLTGAGIGIALRDALLAPTAVPSRMMRGYAPEVYVPGELEEWIETGKRQHAKDRVLLPRLATRFVPGRVLELGAGAGQTAVILCELGWDVLASDHVEFFVEHLQSIGLEARRVDATDIAASGVGRFPNIFCQSITPLITGDVEVIARSYRSLYAALEPGGRLVEIHAMAARHELTATMRLHAGQARLAGFQDVRVTRNQLLPSFAYRRPLRSIASLADLALSRYLGVRFVLVAARDQEDDGAAALRVARATPRAKRLPRRDSWNLRTG